MNDLEALYLILAAIYLIQCIVWIPEDSVCLRRNFHGEWRVTLGWLHFSAWGVRGVLANPLPPLDALAVCDRFPFCVSPDGVLPSPRASLRATGASPENILPFDELDAVQAHGKEVRVAGKRLFRVPSAGMARHAAEFLEELRKKKEPKRAAIIDAEFARQLDAAAVRARLEDLHRRTALLRWNCNVLLIYLFLLLPLAITLRGLSATWMWLLGLLLAQMVVITWLFRRAHRALLPDEKDTRWTATLTILLSPPVAIRAGDVLLRDLLSLFHPLAVARELCNEKYFLELASRTLREARFPLPSAVLPGSAAQKVEEWSREAHMRAVETFVAACGTAPQTLLGPPVRDSGECLSYCPRCWNQYLFAEGACPDCGGIAVEVF